MDDVYRALFCELYRCDAPVVRLADVVHWAGVARSLGAPGLALDDRRVYVPSGYFYRPHTPAPAHTKVRQALEIAAEHDAAVLYPVVRRHARSLALGQAGLTPLPWFVEAEYAVRETVEHDLRAQLGGRRFRDLRRQVRKAADRFELRVMDGRELAGDAGARRALDRLHRANLAKYGHRHNHFSADVLDHLLASPLGSCVRVAWRMPRAGGPPVQALLALLDPRARRLELLVQGIDHARVAPDLNLYAATVFELFAWGSERGVETFGLGRGAEQAKLALGANAFHLLENHVGPGDRLGTAELDALHRAAASRLRGALDELGQSVRRRGAAGLVALPSGS